MPHISAIALYLWGFRTLQIYKYLNVKLNNNEIMFAEDQSAPFGGGSISFQKIYSVGIFITESD